MKDYTIVPRVSQGPQVPIRDEIDAFIEAVETGAPLPDIRSNTKVPAGLVVGSRVKIDPASTGRSRWRKHSERSGSVQSIRVDSENDPDYIEIFGRLVVADVLWDGRKTIEVESVDNLTVVHGGAQ